MILGYTYFLNGTQNKGKNDMLHYNFKSFLSKDTKLKSNQQNERFL